MNILGKFINTFVVLSTVSDIIQIKNRVLNSYLIDISRYQNH